MALRVLCITSDPRLASTVAHGLGVGFEVTAHDNLMGLYPLVVKLEPHVLLLDGDLPRLALEASAKFLRGKGISRNIPILLYTTPTTDVDADPYRLVLQCQAADFVEKAADLKLLRRRIAALAPDALGFDAFPDTGSGEHPVEQRPVARSAEGKPLVLVVDDDDTIAGLLKRILSSRYAVTAVNDGKSAVDACRTHSFAAVFCDLRMPGLTGPDVYRAVALIDPALTSRFIFITAHQLEELESEFFMGLKNHVVHKPFSMREILAAAEQVIGAV